ncbi:OmpA family protein [Luteimonas sp. R10]|uniref:OmpA family protein n=1 Tax=Luteimonas sp. R10 TaxID=3108176 RepID=UPI003093602C|nr:OmpA family protein [Luteimonas sp. R10]
MASQLSRHAGLAALALTAALAGCTNYIKRDEFDATVAELRAADQQLASQIQALSDKHDALVTQLAGRTRLDTAAYFGFDDATLDERAKPLLDDFADVIRSSHSQALVTVEGFTDPAGPASYNKRLGQARADAVRDYLVNTAGLPAGQVRAVSYGEDENRLVRPDAYGDAGRDNRRVGLIVDYAGPSTAAATT